MDTPTTVAAFAVGLAAVFAAATGIGTLTGPVGTASSAAAPAEHADEPGSEHGSGRDPAGDAAHLPGGPMVAQDGYRLELGQRQPIAADRVRLTFRILGPDGSPVTRYRTEHGQDLHLIVDRRDLADYQHVHPRLAADGTWSVPVDLSDPGAYRVFADFTPADREDGLTLGSDLSVAGSYRPRPLPPVSRTAEVDGDTVTLDGALTPGQESERTLSVSRDGRPVTDLQPYLQAYGHLVALRDGDLAYLHVHPLGSPDDGTTAPGPTITFAASVPSEGAYRLFLDFRHGDEVRKTEFTATTTAG